ncbi:MAG: hypothetical protein QXE28_04760 [Desulfurococcaceae archaeon]
MRKIVLVANTKGGVGKTTLAQHFLLPALGKAIYVDTDTYNSSIGKVENSKHLVKAIKLRAVISKGDEEKAALSRLAREFAELFEKEVSDNIVIDTGGGTTASAVLQALMPAFPEEISMVFIPASEDKVNLEKTVGFVSAFTDRYVIVNMRKEIYDTKLFIPEIPDSYLDLALRHKITLPEIKDLKPEDLNLVDRGLRNLFARLFKQEIDKAIEDIREVLS